MGNPVGVKSVMRSTVSKYEQEQKEKFIQVMSDPRMRYSDALNFVENEIKQSKRMGITLQEVMILLILLKLSLLMDVVLKFRMEILNLRI